MSRKKRYQLSNGRAIRAERHEKAGSAIVVAPATIEESKRFALVIMKASAGLADRAHREKGKGFALSITRFALLLMLIKLDLTSYAYAYYIFIVNG